MELSDEMLTEISYVKISQYRTKVMKSLEERLKHQQSLLKIRKLGHYISKVLAELKAHELVECINPEVRKGRLYRLTDKGDELVKNLR